ncbi:hypothetical protein Mro03_01460 [Microbispora rosea subsp. rosea]|nr:hypothetical protein Mro03_01460 [Microbispora rosea subsp. rosea]
MKIDPVSRWGNRNTFSGRGSVNRTIRFLTEPQLGLFLNVGLRGDAPADPRSRPAYPERDYSFGLLLLATGLRREEGALLLDAEIPTPENMPPGGVHPLTRYGKGGRPRTIYATIELVHAIDIHRSTEREAIIRAAQRRLRRMRRNDELSMVDKVVADRDSRYLSVSGHAIPLELLDDERRARAACPLFVIPMDL